MTSPNNVVSDTKAHQICSGLWNQAKRSGIAENLDIEFLLTEIAHSDDPTIQKQLDNLFLIAKMVFGDELGNRRLAKYTEEKFMARRAVEEHTKHQNNLTKYITLKKEHQKLNDAARERYYTVIEKIKRNNTRYCEFFSDEVEIVDYLLLAKVVRKSFFGFIRLAVDESSIPMSFWQKFTKINPREIAKLTQLETENSISIQTIRFYEQRFNLPIEKIKEKYGF